MNSVLSDTPHNGDTETMEREEEDEDEEEERDRGEELDERAE